MSAPVPWEFVQDDTDERRGTARVLDSRNGLVCETTPADADLIVCAVNYLTAAGDEPTYVFFHEDGPIRLTQTELCNEYMRLRVLSSGGGER